MGLSGVASIPVVGFPGKLGTGIKLVIACVARWKFANWLISSPLSEGTPRTGSGNISTAFKVMPLILGLPPPG